MAYYFVPISKTLNIAEQQPEIRLTSEVQFPCYQSFFFRFQNFPIKHIRILPNSHIVDMKMKQTDIHSKI